MNDLEHLLYRALEEPVGLRIQSPDLPRLLRKLYVIRRSQPIYSDLSFVRRPNELWILNRRPDNET